MTDSPRMQMQKVIEANMDRPFTQWKRDSARYVLDNPQWLSLLRGRQAFFRDFILELLDTSHRYESDRDDLLVTVNSMVDNRSLWDAFNYSRQVGRRLAQALCVAINSLNNAGRTTTASNVQKVTMFLVGAHAWLPFVQDKRDYDYPKDSTFGATSESCLDAAIVVALLDEEKAVKQLTTIFNNGIEDSRQALALMEQGLHLAVLDGAL